MLDRSQWHESLPRRGRLIAAFIALLMPLGCSSDDPAHRPVASSDWASRRTGNGPLLSAPPNGYALRRDKGQIFTDGWMLVYNAGDAPVTILRVTSGWRGNGLRQIGVMIADPNRRPTMFQAVDGYPPRTLPFENANLGPIKPAEGYVIPPIPPQGGAPKKKGYQLLIGTQVNQASGRSSRTYIEIQYAYQGRTYTDRWVNTIAVCTPAAGPTCPQEYGQP